MPLDDALRYAAERIGVQQDFWDIFGHRHYTTPETNRAILTALGFDCASEDSLRASLAKAAEIENRRPLPPVLVLSENEPVRIPGVPGLSISRSSPNKVLIIASASRTACPSPI